MANTRHEKLVSAIEQALVEVYIMKALEPDPELESVARLLHAAHAKTTDLTTISR